MTILIDGYNLLHAAGLGRSRYGPGDLEKARTALLNLLAASLGEQLGQTLVVFDAAHAPPDVPRCVTHKGLEVRFAPVGGDADTLLEELIQQDSAPRQLTVVTSDRRVQRAARRRRAHVVASEVFFADLLRRRSSRRKQVPAPQEPRVKYQETASDQEVDFWLAEFQIADDPDDLAEFGLEGVKPLRKHSVRRKGSPPQREESKP